MIKSRCSGNIIDTNMPIIAVPVTATGEEIPKILRYFKECLAEYKRIVKRGTAASLNGRCIPIFNRDEKCFALMFVRGCDENCNESAIKQLEYYSDVTDCGVAFRSSDFDELLMSNMLTCDIEIWE